MPAHAKRILTPNQEEEMKQRLMGKGFEAPCYMRFEQPKIKKKLKSNEINIYKHKIYNSNND
jgi:hypothetical protein